ncbi:MAG: AIPR family protein [Candidatus Cloacimonadaceae bacterium]
MIKIDITDFKKEIWTDIKTTAQIDGEGSSAAFVKIIAKYLCDADVLSELISSFYLGRGRRNRNLRVDGYSYEEIDNSMTLVICDYQDEEKRDALTKTEAEKHFDKLKYFIEEGVEGRLEVEESTPVSDLVNYLTSDTSRENIHKFRLFLITNTVMSTRIKELPSDAIFGIPVELQIYDLERVFQLSTSNTGRENIEIDFQKLAGGIPCIEASDLNTENYKSYLCIIPGKTLADIYDMYGGRLLEENVRMFLSNNKGVNAKIKKTILQNPERFFAYNNGISVTVRKLSIEKRREGSYITYTDDFQIINGGQTTASLSTARYKDKAGLDNIYVPMKLTWMIDRDQDSANQLIRDISYSANSQNKVTDTDFFSTHPFHIRMEKLSRNILAPPIGGAQYATQWFYERVRGQYLQSQARMTKANKDKFILRNPKSQVINKTDVAKVLNTWAMKPDEVSKGAQSNFKDFAEDITASWEINKDIYDEQYFKETVALYILFKYTENMITHQSWYEGGFRANIVTYSLAFFHKCINEQFPHQKLDLMLIWNRQSVPDTIKDDLISISKLVYATITDEDRPIKNVTQWCKRPKCWEQVQQSYLSLNEKIKVLLISQ